MTFLSAACTPYLYSPPAAAYTPASEHGDRYYDKTNGKFLGPASQDSGTYRLIDSGTFDRIRKAREDSGEIFKMLRDSSLTITINYRQIQAGIQNVRDMSMKNGIEYQLYLFLDRRFGQISSVPGKPGDNEESHPLVKLVEKERRTFPDVPEPNRSSFILIGQVHGHPQTSADSTRRTQIAMSPHDLQTARCLQVPVYAVDALDGRMNTPGDIHRANVDSTESLNIATSWGKRTFGTKIKIDIALNAFEIWGQSQTPDFECIKRIGAENRSAASIR